MTAKNNRFKGICAAFMLCIFSTTASAHEYWLEPVAGQWVAGDSIKADIRNGENFVGNSLPFDPDAFARAGLISENHRTALSGRLGDYPAFRMPVQDSGLHLLLLETTRRELLHESYSEFEAFLHYHGLESITERHQNRGLPDEDIVEHYYRYCKSLVDIRNPKSNKAGTLEEMQSEHSALAPQAQRLELIALDNPMQDNTLQLQLHFEGAALAARQVEMFYRHSDSAEVLRTVLDTDASGLVAFDISGPGDYLFNSVQVLEPADPSAHWETLWASLTFIKNAELTQ